MKITPTKRWLSLVCLSLLFVGCQVAQEEIPPTVANVAPENTPTANPSPTAVMETNTPMPEPTATAVPPTDEPTAEPLPTATPEPPETEISIENGIEAFALQSIEEMINGRIRDLQPGSNNSIWVVSDEAAFRWENGRVAETLDALPGRFVGEDTANGLVWAADLDNSTISAWDGSQWLSYGPESGWAALDDTAPSFVRVGVNDENGRFWVTTNTDIRIFDGEQWQQITPEEMGLENIVDDSTWFNFTLLPAANGDMWVGTCHVNPPGPNGGQGVRIFQEETWLTIAGPPEASCVSSFQGDPNGSLWVNFDGGIWNRPAPDALWDSYFPPESEFGRYGTIADIELDANGDAWVLSIVCGGASCGTISTLFHIVDGVWNPVPDWMFPSFSGSDLFVDGTGNMWGAADRSLVWIESETQSILGSRSALFATQTENGRIWFIANNEDRDPILYSLSDE